MSDDKPEPRHPSLNSQIDDLKKNIRELWPEYQARRLELGLTLYKLRELTAHKKTGTFTHIVVDELKIPRSTVYDLLDFAEGELKRIEREMSKFRTKAQGEADPTIVDVDFSDPEQMEELLRIAYPEGVPPKQKRKPIRYLSERGSQIHLMLDYDTRLEVAAAWKLIRPNKKTMKRLCYRLAKEIINAAAKIATSPDKGTRRATARSKKG
jgi:hypothetical protein